MTITVSSPLRQEINFTATDKLPVSAAAGRHAFAFYRNGQKLAREITFSHATIDNPIVAARWAIAKNDVVVFEYHTDGSGDVLIEIVDYQTIKIPTHTITIPGYPYQYDIRVWRQDDVDPIIPIYGRLLVLEDL